MKDTFQVVLINYANDLFQKSQKINSQTGKDYGLFDKVISYNPKDVSNEFKNLNREILVHKRGNGYWLWKPYFIKKALEDLDWGDFLFYCDSGSYFINPVTDLISLSLEKQLDIIPFELPYPESNWTKRDAFILMDCDREEYTLTKQRLASFVLIRKSPTSIAFTNDWLNFAQDKRILTDIENECGQENYPDFIDHRHDQSIFSLLTKKYSLTAFRDPSQFGNEVVELYPNSNYSQLINLNRKRKFPLHILIKKYFTRKKQWLMKMFTFSEIKK